MEDNFESLENLQGKFDPQIQLATFIRNQIQLNRERLDRIEANEKEVAELKKQKR